MSSSSTLFSSSYHVTNNNNNSNNNNNNKISSGTNTTSNSFNQLNGQPHLTMIKNNSGVASTANNSFIYSSAPSPTISLISSSSSSPTSSSSSPIQMATNSSSSFSNKSVMFGNNSSNISAAKKTAALQNIAASIARSQQLSLASINSSTNGAASNQNLANKILALTLENNGVACSVVKSNTNIYYNSKVDTAASKAIHYCTHCTNSDCKAIHKSLTKPLNAASSALATTSSVNVSQSTPLPTPSMATPLFNNQNNQNTNATSNTPTSSQQQQLARLFLTSKLEQLDKQANLQRQHHQSIKQHIGEHFNSSQQQHQQQQQQQHQNTQFNKLLGANVNFIFERRYPLVQLNSNLFNISSSNPTGAAETQASQSLINFINNAGPNSLRSLSPLSNSALTSALSSLTGNNNSSSFHNHSSNRNIMQYRGGTNHTQSQNLFSSDDNETSSMSSPSVSPKGAATSFPVPISPSNTTVDALSMSPPKSTTFSINFNRLPNAASPTSNSSSPTSSSSSPSLNSSNNTTTSSSLVQPKQPTPQPLLDDVDPMNLNNLSLRYKNILFLDQVSPFPIEFWNQIIIKCYQY